MSWEVEVLSTTGRTINTRGMSYSPRKYHSPERIARAMYDETILELGEVIVLRANGDVIEYRHHHATAGDIELATKPYGL